jgi:hypothetical protein
VIFGRVGLNSLDVFFFACGRSFVTVHHTFVTVGSFIACSIEGVADGGVVVWLFLSIEPALRPSVCCCDDTRRFIGCRRRRKRYCSKHITINRAAQFMVSFLWCRLVTALPCLTHFCVVAVSLTDAKLGAWPCVFRYEGQRKRVDNGILVPPVTAVALVGSCATFICCSIGCGVYSTH